jgi:hypothetical protein
MTTHVQHVSIGTIDPSPFPTTTDPPKVTLTADYLLSPLYLGIVQVACQPNPPGHSPTGRITRVGKPGRPGSAEIYFNGPDYHAFCECVRAHPSHVVLDITYDDQNNAVFGCECYPTATAIYATLQQITEQLDRGVIRELRTLNANVLKIAHAIDHRMEPTNGERHERIVSDVAPRPSELPAEETG